MHKLSKIFRPVLVTPQNVLIKHDVGTSRSQKLMTELGLIRATNNGTFQLLPIAQRALDKCIALVNKHMLAADGQKLTLPILTSASLWKKSGRLEGDISEFYLLRDRHRRELLLSPTHEEAITATLAACAPISYKQLPLRLYQIGPKFRDEIKPRFGLMRAKEFIMKDMYSFDTTQAAAEQAYEAINQAYSAFFGQLQVPFVKVEADSGIMGGTVSHEYNFLANTGEEQLLTCDRCNFAANMQFAVTLVYCPTCKAKLDIGKKRGIEVAHTFLLGDKYSKPLGATFLQADGKPAHLIMGCYGIGLSRILAAALEVLSTEQQLRWPRLLAPYDVCLIGPKQGSKEEQPAEALLAQLSSSLGSVLELDNVLYDDRQQLTIGKRLLDAKRMGYPLIVVAGAKAMQTVPKLELHHGEQQLDLELNELLQYLNEEQKRKLELLRGNCKEAEVLQLSAGEIG